MAIQFIQVALSSLNVEPICLSDNELGRLRSTEHSVSVALHQDRHYSRLGQSPTVHGHHRIEIVRKEIYVSTQTVIMTKVMMGGSGGGEIKALAHVLAFV